MAHPGDDRREDAVRVPVEDWLDLHAFRPEEVVDLVTEYLRLAAEAGIGEVRIVHGRGRGVQREMVRRLLAASPLVRGFGDAPAARGGWGATVAQVAVTPPAAPAPPAPPAPPGSRPVSTAPPA